MKHQSTKYAFCFIFQPETMMQAAIRMPFSHSSITTHGANAWIHAAVRNPLKRYPEAA
ncbi:hypothetical protein PT2222_80124 [Paraburkholderia tropica]